MGSKLGKSTVVPTATGRMCGVKRLLRCVISARGRLRGMGAGPGNGSSHSTTPEKSECLRTLGSCDETISTRPCTDPASSRTAVTSATAANDLKRVRDGEIIVIVQTTSGDQISGTNLSCFEAHKNIGCDAVHGI